ncbi:hypothetical protein QFC22_000141 [Naganishia vaughanmartiniae]|uniref:Uncharacterized protein n=1 Tax=Naganishia vaughanmartiniae TaxID=1424756 RepID=A0ACC2XPK4_9TREE|nr:hypothetical protein QFC22_000141 [Naganishia vaughanmartiniae]
MSSHTSPPIQSTTDILTSLAIDFREPRIRNSYAANHPEFIGWLNQVVQELLGILEERAADKFIEEERKQLVELMRVVANFVADNDDNRTLIHSQTSTQQLLHSILTILTTPASPPSKIDTDLAKPLLGAILNLVLTTTTHPSVQEYWIQSGRWVRVVEAGNWLYLPGAAGEEESDEEREVRAVLASWAWKIVSCLSENEAFAESETMAALPKDTIIHLAAPLQHFTHNSTTPPTSPEKQQQHGNTTSQDLSILLNSTSTIHLLSTTAEGCAIIGHAIYAAGSGSGSVDDDDDDGRNGHDTLRTLASSGSGRAGEWIVRFVEKGDCFDYWEEEEDNEEEEEEGEDAESRGKVGTAVTTGNQPSAPPDAETSTSSSSLSSTNTASTTAAQAFTTVTPALALAPAAAPAAASRPGEKKLGAAKASIMAALAEMCADFEFFDKQDRAGGVADDGRWFWETLMRWMAVGVVDANGKGGRGSREGEDRSRVAGGREDLVSSKNIASQPVLIAHLIHLLDTATPETPAQITHGLVGLLRNLALAPQQQELKRTLLGPVAGACARVGVFCREMDMVDTTSSMFGSNEEILDQILQLQQRTDDQAVKIEVSRLMTTLVTSLAKGGEVTSVDQHAEGRMMEALMRDRRVLACPATLIGLGGQHEMLLAEGVLALALIAKRNTKGKFRAPVPAGKLSLIRGYRLRAAVINVLRESSTALSALRKYVGSPTSAQPVISNICILFLNLASDIKDSTADKATADGRVSEHIAEEEHAFRQQIVDCLSTIAAREDVHANTQRVVEAAQKVWKDVKA